MRTCYTQQDLWVVFGRNVIYKVRCCSSMSDNTGDGNRPEPSTTIDAQDLRFFARRPSRLAERLVGEVA